MKEIVAAYDVRGLTRHSLYFRDGRRVDIEEIDHVHQTVVYLVAKEKMEEPLESFIPKLGKRYRKQAQVLAACAGKPMTAEGAKVPCFTQRPMDRRRDKAINDEEMGSECLSLLFYKKPSFKAGDSVLIDKKLCKTQRILNFGRYHLCYFDPLKKYIILSKNADDKTIFESLCSAFFHLHDRIFEEVEEGQYLAYTLEEAAAHFYGRLRDFASRIDGSIKPLEPAEAKLKPYSSLQKEFSCPWHGEFVAEENLSWSQLYRIETILQKNAINVFVDGDAAIAFVDAGDGLRRVEYKPCKVNPISCECQRADGCCEHALALLLWIYPNIGREARSILMSLLEMGLGIYVNHLPSIATGKSFEIEGPTEIPEVSTIDDIDIEF